MSVDDDADEPAGGSLCVELVSTTRWSYDAVVDIWGQRGSLWSMVRPQLADQGWTHLDDDGPPRWPGWPG